MVFSQLRVLQRVRASASLFAIAKVKSRTLCETGKGYGTLEIHNEMWRNPV